MVRSGTSPAIHEFPAHTGYAAVIIDVVESRAAPSRAELQDHLLAAVAAVGERAAGRPGEVLDPLAITVGDEMQATCSSVLAALRLVAELRLLLRVEGIDARAGIGWGAIVVRDPARAPLAQDGPAWWRARAALDAVADSTAWAGYERRTAADLPRGAADDSTPDNSAPDDRAATAPGLPAPRPLDVVPGPLLDSYLALLDRNLGLLDAQDALVVLHDLAGGPTAPLAERLGVAANSVSMRRSRNHLRELTHALGSLSA
ncbi:MAG: SatD family protein [Acidimicrobiales bacterium]